MSRGRSSSGGRGFSSSSSRSSSSRGSSRSSYRSSSYSRPRTTVVFTGGSYSSYSGGGSSGGKVNSKVALFVTAIILMIMGGLFLSIGINASGNANDYGSVQGKAIRNTYSGGWYYTTYEYTVQGREYTNRSQEGWEYPEDEGRYVTIYYLKSDPNYITELEPEDGGDGVVFTIVGIVFLTIGVFFIIGAIKAKKEKEEVAVNKEEPSVTIEPSKTVTCPYCGSTYNKNLSSCPNCGSGNKINK